MYCCVGCSSVDWFPLPNVQFVETIAPELTEEVLVNDVALLRHTVLLLKETFGKGLMVTGIKAVSVQPILVVQMSWTLYEPVLA